MFAKNYGKSETSSFRQTITESDIPIIAISVLGFFGQGWRCQKGNVGVFSFHFFSGNTGADEHLTVEQSTLIVKEAQSLCNIHSKEPPEVVLSADTPKTKSISPCKMDDILEDEGLKPHLSLVLNSLTKPELDILFSPRRGNAFPVSSPATVKLPIKR